jgi:hypothetical protein
MVSFLTISFYFCYDIFYKKLKNIFSIEKMATLSNNLVAKSGKSGNPNYYCEKCHYICFKKYNWNKHLTTSKHIKATNDNNLAT